MECLPNAGVVATVVAVGALVSTRVAATATSLVTTRARTTSTSSATFTLLYANVSMMLKQDVKEAPLTPVAVGMAILTQAVIATLSTVVSRASYSDS